MEKSNLHYTSMMPTTRDKTRHTQFVGGKFELPDGSTYEVDAELRTIGREPGASLVLHSGDTTVSKLHAETQATTEGLHIRDMSLNGIFVDGQKMIEGYLTRPCTVRMGNVELRFIPAAPMNVELAADDPIEGIVGESAEMRKLFRKMRTAAGSDLTVLLLGETGVGKELVAREIHRLSPRASGPFIPVDCGTIPEQLAASILFGHERGAFTGADRRQISPFVQANGGTVFLDEIGNLSFETQQKLLRVLQQRMIKTVGGSAWTHINVRVIAATHRDLRREVREQQKTNVETFRTDLFFRLSQIRLEIPPLRRRLDDLPLLIEEFAKQHGERDVMSRVPARSLARLRSYSWPGNVRELENAVASGLQFAVPRGSGEIDLENGLLDPESLHLVDDEADPKKLVVPSDGAALPSVQRELGPYQLGKAQAAREYDEWYFGELLRVCGDAIAKMMEISELTRQSLYYHFRRLRLFK